MKKGYSSLMEEEIFQSPLLVEKLARAMGKAAPWGAKTVNPPLVVFIGRGSSDHAGLYGRYLFEAELGLPVVNAAPSLQTLLKKKMILPPGSLIVAISQSGQSTDVVACLERLKTKDSVSIAITNQSDSPMAKAADHVISLGAGMEKSVAATKTYSLSLAAVYAIKSWLKGHNPQEHLLLAAEDMHGSLEEKRGLDELALRYTYAQEAVVLGRIFHYASAKEFALKLTETCSMATLGASSADFQHGPIAMLKRGYPAFVFATKGPGEKSHAQLMEKLTVAGVEPIIFSDHLDFVKKHIGCAIPGKAPKGLSPLSLAPLFQLFAASLSRHRGLSPDKPQFLNKVTRTF